MQEHRANDAERAQQILSKLISSIIVHCSRPNYHNYLLGGTKSPRRILTRACPESMLQNLENFISARACNTRLEVRVSLCVLLIFRLPTKEEHRHSTIRANFIVREIRCQNPRRERDSEFFCGSLCEKKKWRDRSMKADEVSSSSIDRTLSVSYVYTSPEAIEVSVV